jgi:hypothetical protein
MPGAPATRWPVTPKVVQRADHRIFQPVHIFLDEVAQALQIQQRIGHHLTGAVVGHLAAAVGGHHRNIAGVQHMVGLPARPWVKVAGVLADPELVRCAQCVCA